MSSEPGGQPTRRDAAGEAAVASSDVGHRIDATGLSAWYASRQAFDDVTLTLPPRRVTAVLGPAGSGKTTFLRCLNRLHETVPRARVRGSVKLDGREMYDPSVDPVRVRRAIGMVFQQPNPFPTMSVFDNVLAGVRLQGGVPRRELEEIGERALRDAGLFEEVRDHWKGRSGASLTVGQQQRLCVARALAVQPEVLLMDEPCSVLDPIATFHMEEMITSLKDRITIALATQSIQQASRVSDLTAVFLPGQDRVGSLVEFGETPHLFTSPMDARTEAYLTGRFG